MEENEELIRKYLLPDVELYPVEPHIFSVYPESDTNHHYDQNVNFYDRVIGNRLYNRIMWGYDSREFSRFIQIALARTESGCVLDAGCGSLVFTADVYAENLDRQIIMLDQSIEMLRAAKGRITRLSGGSIAAGIVFLQGDILQLPFYSERFSTVVSLSVLHVLEEAQEMIAELVRVLEEGGNLFLTSFVTGRGIGDKYLEMLHNSGGVAEPRSSEQVMGIFSNEEINMVSEIKGNMMFIRTE